ncbi:MAG: enoyl-CoA hydratase [Dongiaceae bacterium]
MTGTVLIERSGRVAIVRLHRPDALNALNVELLNELVGKLGILDRDPEIGSFLITGSDRAFAAGAAIKEMQDRSVQEMLLLDWFAGWDGFARLRTPIVAAVCGYALGGGCVLATMCDVVIAADTAKFGQPELRLGVIPGMGGTQRLARAVGKAKAADLILTGRIMDAEEAERAGLVARVVPAERLFDEALEVAAQIAALSKPAVMLAKEALGRAFESPLSEGLLFERRAFHALFATEDQKEGMRAFVEKRPPTFMGR